MDIYLQVLRHIIETPFLWQSLGFITACAMFIGPFLYNGDYRSATKTIICVLGYAFFVALLQCFHLFGEGVSVGTISQPVIILLIVFLAYSLGIFLGLFIHRFVIYSKNKQSQGKRG